MLSILIPTYNYNVEALVAELHQQATDCQIDFEIIIGDDFSNQTIYNAFFGGYSYSKHYPQRND